MSLIRKIAAVVSLVNGAWGAVVGLFWVSIFPSTPHQTGAGADYAMLALGVVLLLVSVACFTGFSGLFYVSALLSVVMLVFVPGGVRLGELFLASLGLAVTTIALDAVAANSREYIPEQNHPLNLPVFG